MSLEKTRRKTSSLDLRVLLLSSTNFAIDKYYNFFPNHDEALTKYFFIFTSRFNHWKAHDLPLQPDMTSPGKYVLYDLTCAPSLAL